MLLQMLCRGNTGAREPNPEVSDVEAPRDQKCFNVRARSLKLYRAGTPKALERSRA